MPDHKTILLKTSPENCALFTKNTQHNKQKVFNVSPIYQLPHQESLAQSSLFMIWNLIFAPVFQRIITLTMSLVVAMKQSFSVFSIHALQKKIRNANHEGLLALTFQNLFDDYFNFEREQVFKTRVFLTLEYGLN